MCTAFGLPRYASRGVRSVLDVQLVVGRWRLRVFACWQRRLCRCGASCGGGLVWMRWVFGRCPWCHLRGDGCRFRCLGGACLSDCIFRGWSPRSRTWASCVWVFQQAVWGMLACGGWNRYKLRGLSVGTGNSCKVRLVVQSFVGWRSCRRGARAQAVAAFPSPSRKVQQTHTSSTNLVAGTTQVPSPPLTRGADVHSQATRPPQGKRAEDGWALGPKTRRRWCVSRTSKRDGGLTRMAQSDITCFDRTEAIQTKLGSTRPKRTHTTMAHQWCAPRAHQNESV